MPTRTAFIIRIALMTGVFLYAAIVWIQGPSAAVATGSADRIQTLRYVLWGLVPLSAVVALLLRPRLATATPEMQGRLLLIGWSVGEAAALLGITIRYMGGPVSSMALGVLAFVTALLLLPVPRLRR